MTGVEKHAEQARIEIVRVIRNQHDADIGAAHREVCAVLVAARDHNTRQAEAIELIERIADHGYGAIQKQALAVAALRLLRGEN